MTQFTKDNYKWPLLSTANKKTKKGEKFGFMTYIMYMAPHTQNSKGVNLCPKASEGCANACLFHSGFGGLYSSVEQARINKTEFYLNDRIGFLDYLMTEIALVVNKHKTNPKYAEFTPVFRLNGTTDIAWEKQKGSNGKTVMETFPDYQFYDYTKVDNRMYKKLPDNYHLTFSRSEENEETAVEILKAGYNVAVVFDKLPKTWKGYPVVSGDETDLRFLDEKNVVVGLKYKKLTKRGKSNDEAFKSGFVVDTSMLKVA